MQSRTTSQKLYSRKRCPPLKEMTLLFKYYKTWDWVWFYLAIRKRKVTASKKEAISPPPLPRKQRKSEIPTNQYCITLQETQRQQRQHIIWKIRMNITNQFITKLSILFLTPSKIDLSVDTSRGVVFESGGQARCHRRVESTEDTFQRWLWCRFTHFRASTTSNDL